MKVFASLILILITVQGIFAQQDAISQKPLHGPKLEFVEKGYDFGNIEEGIKVSHDFEITNTGDSNLILLNVQATCGCTVPTWPKQPIKPGEKAKITIQYNSARRAGEAFHQSVTVTTNMKKDHVFIFYVRGKVNYKTEQTN